MAGLCVGDGLRAADPTVGPHVTALTPLVVPQGFVGTIRLRGSKLKDATGVRTSASTVPATLEIKEKKEAAVPPGLDATQAGDSEVIIDLVLGPDFPIGPLPLAVAVGEQTAEPVVLGVRAAGGVTAETEPNNGFRGAMKIDPERSVTGVINAPRDVDVFEVSALAGRKIRASVTAREVASLLDPLLTAYDAAGNRLAGADDAGSSRDAVLELTPAVDGPIFLVIQDAFDGGSDGHSYFLEFHLMP